MKNIDTNQTAFQGSIAVLDIRKAADYIEYFSDDANDIELAQKIREFADRLAGEASAKWNSLNPGGFTR